MFWFFFQKYSSGLAATLKDLKIWKQALGKRTTRIIIVNTGSAKPRVLLWSHEAMANFWSMAVSRRET